MEWKNIPKDKDGLFIEDGTMYEQLPVIVCRDYDGVYEMEYIDADSWPYAANDLDDECYKYYMPCAPIPE